MQLDSPLFPDEISDALYLYKAMSTRSAIGYKLPNGKIKAVYCHWDGYPSNQMPILRQKYNTLAAVQALIRPGSMSSLETYTTWNEVQRSPQPLYYKERGDGEAPIIRAESTVEEYWRNWDCEHLYVFHPEQNHWHHIPLKED